MTIGGGSLQFAGGVGASGGGGVGSLEAGTNIVLTPSTGKGSPVKISATSTIGASPVITAYHASKATVVGVKTGTTMSFVPTTFTVTQNTTTGATPLLTLSGASIHLTSKCDYVMGWMKVSFKYHVTLPVGITHIGEYQLGGGSSINVQIPLSIPTGSSHITTVGTKVGLLIPVNSSRAESTSIIQSIGAFIENILTSTFPITTAHASFTLDLTAVGHL